MKIGAVSGMIAAVLIAASPGISSSLPNAIDAPTQMVITVLPAKGDAQPASLDARDLKVQQGKRQVPVVRLQRLAGDLADVQLFVLLDDSTRSFSLGNHLAELKAFIESLPPTTHVAIGYMRNGTFGLVQPFTTDHEIAASALRLPVAMPGENGSPYFALSDLAKHWPSKETTDRRAVLMLTDGVDRYYETQTIEDPYVDAAIHDTLKDGMLVYSIYLRGAGRYGQSGEVTNFAQSRLIEVSQETGGHAYFEAFSDPVTIAPFLNDFKNRLQNQYQVTLDVMNGKGELPVKLRTEVPGVKIEAPTHIYAR
jgi:hypothetical protein